jgi:hypothetical protein
MIIYSIINIYSVSSKNIAVEKQVLTLLNGLFVDSSVRLFRCVWQKIPSIQVDVSADSCTANGHNLQFLNHCAFGWVFTQLISSWIAIHPSSQLILPGIDRRDTWRHPGDPVVHFTFNAVYLYVIYKVESDILLLFFIKWRMVNSSSQWRRFENTRSRTSC